MFNTHAIAQRLTGAGFNPDQADALTAAVRDARADTDHVTRADLDAAIAALEGRMNAAIAALESRMNATVAALESRMAWRFAGAIVAQTLTLIGAMIAIVRMLG